MKRQVQYQNQYIEYEIIRKNVKNINFKVKSDLSVVVSASKRISATELDELVLQKAPWILRMLQEQKERRAALEQNQRLNVYCDGGHIAFLGETKPLRVQTAGERGWQLEDDALRVYGCHTEAEIREQVAHFYQEMCIIVVKEINELVYQDYFAILNMPKATVVVKPLTASWGRCHTQKGRIVLNERLVRAAVPCIVSVLVHEYVHFIYPNHSKDFYSLLRRLLPQYDELTAQLSLQVACRGED